MEYNRELSLVYDTIRFYEIYFNYEMIEQSYVIWNYDIKEVDKLYKKILNDKVVSSRLQAIFGFGDDKDSFLKGLFVQNISSIKTIKDLFEMLMRKNFIINKLVDFYGIGKSYTNDNELTENILDMNLIDEKLKACITVLICKYESVIDQLVKSMTDIYDSIEKLYNNDKLFPDIDNQKLHLNKLKKAVKINKFDESIYCISLLHPYTYKIIEVEKQFIILGSLWDRVLDSQYKYLTVTPKSIAQVVGNDLKMLIIDIIHKQKNIYTAEILKMLPSEYPQSTVYRTINSLHVEQVIHIVKRDSKNIYYALNEEYFKNASIVLNTFLMYYYKDNNISGGEY